MRNRIKAALSDIGKTQDWLAKKMGLSLRTISWWCTNKRQPKDRQFEEIEKVSGIPFWDLIAGPND